MNDYVDYLKSNRESCYHYAITQKQIQLYEQENELHITEELKSLWVEMGGFESKYRDSLDSYCFYGIESRYAVNLYSFIIKFYPQITLTHAFSKNEINFLNENYVVYGCFICTDLDKQSFLLSYLDKSGNAGTIKLNEVSIDNINLSLKNLLNANIAFGLTSIDYKECLRILNTDRLFERDFSVQEIDEHQSEDFEILFYDGNLEVEGDFQLEYPYYNAVVVVRGSLTVKGTMCHKFYVTCNACIDYLQLDPSGNQYCKGKLHINYLADLIAEDDETTTEVTFQKINAPYFFCWFCDLNKLQFDSNVIIFAVGEDDNLRSYNPENTIFKGQTALFALQPDMYVQVQSIKSSEVYWNAVHILQNLRSDKSIFIEGFDPNCMSLYYRAFADYENKNYKAAFHGFQDVLSISPAYYPAYYYAGESLLNVGAYKLAMRYYLKAVSLFPIKFNSSEHMSAVRVAICSVILNDAQKAIEYATIALKHLDKHQFAYRTRGEAFLKINEIQNAKNDLSKAFELDEWHRSTNWLLGSIYYQEKNKEKADFHFARSVNNNYKPLNVYYDQSTDLSFFYKKTTEVDWLIMR